MKRVSLDLNKVLIFNIFRLWKWWNSVGLKTEGLVKKQWPISRYKVFIFIIIFILKFPVSILDFSFVVNWVLILSLFKGTLVYTKQIQTLKADFWKEGVGGSKKLLKKILKKITNYEEQHVNLDEQVNKEHDNVNKIIRSLKFHNFDNIFGSQFF